MVALLSPSQKSRPTKPVALPADAQTSAALNSKFWNGCRDVSCRRSAKRQSIARPRLFESSSPAFRGRADRLPDAHSPIPRCGRGQFLKFQRDTPDSSLGQSSACAVAALNGRIYRLPPLKGPHRIEAKCSSYTTLGSWKLGVHPSGTGPGISAFGRHSRNVPLSQSR